LERTQLGLMPPRLVAIMVLGQTIGEAQLYHYAKPMLRRTVELECFLRWQLLQSTDTILDLA
jgi:hypothetical protein